MAAGSRPRHQTGVETHKPVRKYSKSVKSEPAHFNQLLDFKMRFLKNMVKCLY